MSEFTALSDTIASHPWPGSAIGIAAFVLGWWPMRTLADRVADLASEKFSE